MERKVKKNTRKIISLLKKIFKNNEKEIMHRLICLEEQYKSMQELVLSPPQAPPAEPFLVQGYEIIGENNKIIIVENGVERELGMNEKIEGLILILKGNNNYIKFEMPIQFIANTIIQIGNDNVEVIIEKNCILKAMLIRCCWGESQKLFIGEGTTMTSNGHIMLDENASCIINKDCMFSGNLQLWPTDGHSILDKTTKEILNLLKGPVTIGEHCWIGQGVRITKNARIPNNTIVGCGAVVTKAFTEENTIIAGNPAKIIKTNVEWDRLTPFAKNRKTQEGLIPKIS